MLLSGALFDEYWTEKRSPYLSSDEDVLSPEIARLELFAEELSNNLLVEVDARSVDEPVASLDGCLQGGVGGSFICALMEEYNR